MKYLLTAFFIFILGLTGLLNVFRNGVQYVLLPIEFGLTNVAQDMKGTVSFFFTIGKIKEDNTVLRTKVENLNAAILTLKEASIENKLLRKQLELKNNEGFNKNLLIAGVMGNSSDLGGSTVVIDKGSNDGVSAGVNVIKENYLIGIVREVFARRSVVDLVISPNVSVAVLDIDSPEKTEGIAQGQYGTSIQMTKILPAEKIEEGDTIITSGKDGIFTPGLNVGVVKTVSQVPVEPLKSAFLVTTVDFSRLDKVFLVLK